MALTLSLAGVDRTSMLRPGSLQIPDRISNRSEASFDLVVKVGGYRPAPQEAVQLTLDGLPVFTGFVWDVEETRVINLPGSYALYIRVGCVDSHLLADRRRAPETYDGWTAGAIVTDLHAKYLAAEGVTLGTVQAGPVIVRAVFGYRVPVSQALDEVAELAGFYWQIQAGKVLVFADRTANAAPWALDGAAEVRDVSVRKHPEGYRNTQYTQAGTDLTDVRTDYRKGDAKNRAFTLNYPVGEKPSAVTVSYNGAAPIARTIGIRGLEQGFNFYWSKDDPVISQDDSDTLLTALDELAVTYRGMFPIVAVDQDDAEIAARKAAEGGTGVYEDVEQVAHIDSLDGARQYAKAKLAKHARLNGEVTFKTRRAGLRAGQLLPVNLTAHGVNASYLITEVTLLDEDKLGQFGRWAYSVKAMDGGEVGGWIEFFKRLAQAGKTFVIRENEVLVRLKRLTDGMKVSDTLTLSRAAPVKTVGSALVGFSEVG